MSIIVVLVLLCALKNSTESIRKKNIQAIRACSGQYRTQLVYLSRFCVMAVAGLILLIVAEYIRKFNLFLFFIRLVLHLYAKFMLTLNQHFFWNADPQAGVGSNNNSFADDAWPNSDYEEAVRQIDARNSGRANENAAAAAAGRGNPGNNNASPRVNVGGGVMASGVP